jgi:DUF4097 and DUF4098 domain-containing protein YvlB
MTGKLNLQFAMVAIFLSATLLSPRGLEAQSNSNVDRVVVPLSDPARPVRLAARLLNGSITLKTHAAPNVVVEARIRQEEEPRSKAGAKRLVIPPSTALTIEEENNEVSIGADSTQRTLDLTILVPARTSANLRTVNNGHILVSGISGEINVDNVNGNVTLQDVSGYAVAHALNGELKANFKTVDAQKPMAFSSLNGDIEVTFPADLKANISLQSDRGEVYSDFDVQFQPRAQQPIVEDSRNKGGTFRVRVEKTIRGTINGGGQEIQFKNFNGTIYIRRAGAVGPAAAPATQTR